MDEDKKPIVRIPAPCNEDWNMMLPQLGGKHCKRCDNNVKDFSEMNDQEIIDFFVQNKGKKICGRFRDFQTEKIIGPYRDIVIRRNINVDGLAINPNGFISGLPVMNPVIPFKNK